jgi:RNA polymerase sigma-70 factor (ECF subfamily)
VVRVDEHGGEERRLIERARSGDAAACATLVRAHYAAVYRLLVHLTPGDAHAAEDLCQETFAAAWAKLRTFAGASAFATWLHRIAYRRFLDSRRSARPPTPESSDALDDVADARLPAAADAIAMEESAELYAALDRLDDGDRQVLAMHYLSGLSYRQIAEITGEPAGTVKWRTSAALSKLRLILSETNDELDRRQTTSPAAARPAPAAGPAGA